MHGPVFSLEPPGTVDFSNNTGAKVECAATGSPTPTIRWILSDGSPVTDVPRIRRVLGNGTLLFPPFLAEEYRQDVHAAIYRCSATNPLGTVASRDVWVRAVVMQTYEVQVYDEFVITGNTGVMKCQIPSFVTDYVSVTAWTQEGAYASAVENGPKFTIFPTGELHIKDVKMDDGHRGFRCRTFHRLTKETRTSSTSGRLIVTAPQGSVPPRITDSRLSQQVRQGDTVLLPCSAQGHPPPYYSWNLREKNGLLTPIQETSRIRLVGGSLLIKSPEISDSGVYVCVVNNSIGNEKAETTLTVTAPLTARVEPPQQVVDLGRPAAVRCITSGYPITSITWLRNGKGLNLGRVQVPTPEMLRVPALQREDMGMYQCFVKNNMETVHGTAELRIGDAAPEIQQGFISETFHPGSVLSLACVATGNPQPQMSWTLDDMQIPKNGRFLRGEIVNDRGDLISYLNISSVRTEDGGEYKCIAVNPSGRAEFASRINIYGPPSIRPTRRISALAGGDTVIRCPFVGYPIDSITWEKDSLKLPVNRRQRVFTNGTLEIQNVQSELDAGKYTCVVRSPQGQSVRRDLEVVVVVPPGIAPFSFQGEQFVEGMRTRATCYVSKGDLPITITWLKDGSPLTADSGVGIRVIDEYSSILTIDSVVPEHSGNYTCVARNAAAVANYSARLIVNVPPRWIQEPRDTQILVGQPARLDCRADGSPTPITIWMKAAGAVPGDYREIPSGSSRLFFASNGSLIVSSAVETDEGEYMCQAANGVGAGLSRVVHLHVNVPPYFEVKHKNFTVRKGEDARMLCEARGDLPIKITWFVNGNNLRKSSDLNYRSTINERQTEAGVISELVIRRSERRDNAAFSCQANNSFGNSEALYYLIIQEVPDIPRNLKIIDVKSREAQIEWMPSYDGNSPIVRYIVQYRKVPEPWDNSSPGLSVPGEDTKATVFGLQPDFTYQFRVIAENSVGQSGVSEVISISTDEEAPGGPPQKIQLTPVDSETIKVTWMSPKKDVWFGEILGYNIGYRQVNSSQSYSYKKMEIPNSSSSNYQYVISGLRKFTHYGIVVQAFNRHGNGPNSPEVLTQTLEDVPSKPPQNIKCVAVSSQSLKITWEKPPLSEINGILQGYKVIYKTLANRHGGSTGHTKTTSEQAITLHSLETFTNYSVQVLAFTRLGNGSPSEPIACSTDEDVPDAPADIKAAITSADAILVAWKPPARSKGKVVRYTVYVRALDGTKEETVKHTVPSSQTTFSANGLRKNKRHEFWVTASTSVGEGQSTKVIAQSPSSKVPAKIISFSDDVNKHWKMNVSLPCRAVGNPQPEVDWILREETLPTSDRIRIAADGTLEIMEAQSGDVGNYTCRAKNNFGTDAITYKLVIQTPPNPPSIHVISIGLTSISLQWDFITDSSVPVSAYCISFRKEYGEWEERQLEPEYRSYALENLWCGTRYQLYMTAYSTVGPGRPSEILAVKTKGSAPIAPPREAVLRENITSVTLLLDSWSGDGCSILYFVIKYKLRGSHEWALVSNHVKPQERFVIGDLQPDTAYRLEVTAHNSAGSTTAEYDFNTHSSILRGSPPQGSIVTTEAQGVPYYSALLLKIIVPTAAAIFIIVVIVSALCILIRKKRDNNRREREAVKTNPKYALVMERSPMADLKVQPNNPHSNQENMDTQRTVPLSSLYPSPMAFQDEVSPYATFQLAGFSREREEAESQANQMEQQKSSNTTLRMVQNADVTATYSKITKQRQNPHYHPDPTLSDETVPDLLYHSQESSSSNEASPDLSSRGLSDGMDMTYQCYSTLNKGRYPSPYHEGTETSSMFLNQDMPPPYFTDCSPTGDPNSTPENYYQYLKELKMTVNNPDSSKAPSIIRRHQEFISGQPGQTRSYAKDYTIAV